MNLNRFDKSYLDAFNFLAKGNINNPPPKILKELNTQEAYDKMEAEVEEQAAAFERGDSECDFMKEHGRTILKGVNNQTESAQNLYF